MQQFFRFWPTTIHNRITLFQDKQTSVSKEYEILSFCVTTKNGHRQRSGNLWASFFCARQHWCRVRYILSPVRLSVTRVDQSKTVEVRIMQRSPQISPISLLMFCDISLIEKFWRVPLNEGVKQGWGGENKPFSSFMRLYPENGMRYNR